ncbi:hypothetical protein CYMTET_38153 [Cymbomonas tetramitiformis]|uniref:Uncharacterized protein n=1 Tax=Cymbomonas tetramitiformis TaxID=36881 RepID=A0AAE0CE15_9CHLO|nr:hypothetical protein CYMTET_38153 [Cymbomonas tetramitiformis]
MYTDRQHARMTAVRSALESLRLRRQHSASGFGLVLSGGACAPDTKHDSDIFAIDNECYDSYESASPHSSPSRCVLPRYDVVVLENAFRLPPPLPRAFDTFVLEPLSAFPTFLPLCHLPLVVLGHVTPWPRTVEDRAYYALTDIHEPQQQRDLQLNFLTTGGDIVFKRLCDALTRVLTATRPGHAPALLTGISRFTDIRQSWNQYR